MIKVDTPAHVAGNVQCYVSPADFERFEQPKKKPR
jgi:hypothetical protein